MKIAIIVGTRPEIIKMASIIKECQRQSKDFILIHTNQHYSNNMDAVFFEQLDLPKPHYNLKVGSHSQGKQTGIMLERIESVLLDEKPDVALVQGDTNTVLAGALAATKLHIKVGHVEAGLRSFDRAMPEEINRVMTDHISDFLFCPTQISRQHCQNEGVDDRKLFVVGNTIVDAIDLFSNKTSQTNTLSTHNLAPKQYILLTAHRPANVDSKENLEKLLNLIEKASDELRLPVLYPIHPRTRKNIETFGLRIPDCITLLDPVPYFDFQTLLINAAFTITDSGGIQEEACVHKVPCITIRENTERPETLQVGANVLVGLDCVKALQAVSHLTKNPHWQNPFGDGTSARKILAILDRQLQNE